MPRRIVYGIAFWVFLAGVALTLTSISLPNWISYTSPSTSPSSDPVHVTYGLHSRCSSLTNTCEPFPQDSDCRGDERSFCSMWRSVGFLMNFTVVLELACFVGFLVVILGGRGKRESGWKMVSGLSAVVVVCQAAAMGIVAFLNDHDVRFQIGWKLDTSTILCTFSWIILGLNAAGMTIAAYTLQPEDDYEQID
ncbi:F-box protein pof12 [Sphaceloma murrayae]|uniref:F-box protein pof12 n=1 Tax=Sphaceloma murrayae TaxID=2082308 RepID=A0A2K1QVF2_9PEZI|nr:F-box protein pof12 [Sphaceloma murrayae]